MKTAVEIIETKIQADSIALYEGFLTFKEFMDNIDNYFNEAKQMEKFQMYLSRVPIAYEDKSWQGLMERHFEQWYNETFKSE